MVSRRYGILKIAYKTFELSNFFSYCIENGLTGVIWSHHDVCITWRTVGHRTPNENLVRNPVTFLSGRRVSGKYASAGLEWLRSLAVERNLYNIFESSRRLSGDGLWQCKVFLFVFFLSSPDRLDSSTRYTPPPPMYLPTNWKVWLFADRAHASCTVNGAEHPVI